MKNRQFQLIVSSLRDKHRKGQEIRGKARRIQDRGFSFFSPPPLPFLHLPCRLTVSMKFDENCGCKAK